MDKQKIIKAMAGAIYDKSLDAQSFEELAEAAFQAMLGELVDNSTDDVVKKCFYYNNLLAMKELTQTPIYEVCHKCIEKNFNRCEDHMDLPEGTLGAVEKELTQKEIMNSFCTDRRGNDEI